VLLSGTRDRLRPAVEGGAYIKDAVRGGGLVREESPRREALYTFGWTGFALVSLVAVMLVTFIMQDCPSSVVKVNPGGSTIGSLGAASDLEDSGSSAAFRNTNMVVSDGAVPAAEYPGLVGHPVAVVIFAVVVNRATGVSSLTESQLDGIWTGKYQNWRQLGGANLPIDVVSRNTDSGTRATFDHKILRMATEIPQSSQSCTSRDLITASPVTRCDVVLLAGRDPSAEAVNAGPNSYPFWAVEYMYTYGTPAPGTLLSAFLGYMSTDAAKSSLQNDGEIPCSLTKLCP
jgi:phosphate transport system substrate-binding protein